MSRNHVINGLQIQLWITALSAFFLCAGETCFASLEELGQGAPKGESQVPSLLPGGIADPAGRTGFFVNDKEAIEAVDLTTGKSLWTTPGAFRPLLVHGDRLLVAAAAKGKSNVLRIMILDVKDKGKQLKESEPVTFPDWVSVQNKAVERISSSFVLSPKIIKGHLYLNWQAHSMPVFGSPVPKPEKKKEASGVARIDLESGRVEMLPAEHQPLPQVPAEMKKASRLFWFFDRLSRSAAWTGNGVPLELPGKKLALLIMETGQPKPSKLLVQTWDSATGKVDAARELLQGQEFYPAVTLDGTHALVRSKTAEKSAWTWFSLAQGKPVMGAASYPANYFERGTCWDLGIALLGDRWYYAVEKEAGGGGAFIAPRLIPRELRAVDLHSGKTLWQKPIQGRWESPPVPGGPGPK